MKTLRIEFRFTKGSWARAIRYLTEQEIRLVLDDGALEELERQIIQKKSEATQ